MTNPAWARLVRLYQTGMLRLVTGETLAHPELAETPDFRDAAWRLALDMVREVARVNATSWRAAAVKSTRARQIYAALHAEIERNGFESELSQLAYRNAQLITSLPAELAERVTAHAAELEQKGARAVEIEREIRRLTPELAGSRIRLIARTEISRAETDLTRVRSERIGIEWYQWQTSEDQRVRRSHRNMDQVLVAWGDPPQPEELVGEKSTLGRAHAGCFPNCFPGDSLVTSPSVVKRIWRAPYDGDLIVLSCRGVVIPVTPNHPLLTGRGWLPAYAINSGDDLIQVRRDGGEILDSNSNNRIATFENLFRAHAGKTTVETRPRLAFNFYGDVPNGDVQEISIDSDLPLNRVAQSLETICDLALSGAYRRILGSIRGGFAHIISALLPGFLYQMEPLFAGGLRHTDIHGIRRASPLDAMFSKNPGYGPPRSKVQALGNSQFAFSGQVSGDDVALRQIQSVVLPDLNPLGAKTPAERSEWNIQSLAHLSECNPGFYKGLRVIDKGVRSFTGHVYTLQSGSGWYCATPAQIIAQNCRCVSLPVADLNEIHWPAKVYSAGRIRRMTRAEFTRVIGIQIAA
jgi:hypothetical protein